jgi:ferredoxin
MKAAIIKTSTQVDLISIEKDKINPNIYDYIIIGGPVYVERYPEILLRYLENNLSDYSGTCMLYSTQATEGQTPVFKHTMKRIKKVNVTYYDYLAMPNNFYNFMFKQCSKEKESELIKSATEKAEKIALEFCEGKTNSYDISNNRVIMAEAAYRLTYPFLRNFLMRKLKVDKNKCIKCGLCEKSCPTQSIKICPDLKINNKCTFCQRCINKCPKNAFLYKNKPIIQYNPKRG